MSAGKSGKGNFAASVRQRLLNQARNGRRPFNELLQYYAMERFLYRLSQSEHADRFILKGALMLGVWRSSKGSTQFRPTMDIDMLGRTSNDEDSIIAQIKDIISIDSEPDGLIFDPATIRTERITEDAKYEGIRVRFTGSLDAPAPRLLCYSRESAIAEKFEAMLKLGELNSRMKDFYDIWLLSRQFNFEGNELAEAIRLTLEHRGTAIPEIITPFTKEFIEAKQVQWAAFHKRLAQESIPTDFGEIVAGVEAFLKPIAAILSPGTHVPTHWVAPGPWV